MFKWHRPEEGKLDTFDVVKVLVEWCFKIAGWITLLGALKFAADKSHAALFENAYYTLAALPAVIVSALWERVRPNFSKTWHPWVGLPIYLVIGICAWLLTIIAVNTAADAIAVFQASTVR